MGLLSSFLDKHYPHEEMVKQRKKGKGISAASSSDLLPLKSILEVLLNKSMRPDPYVAIDDQVMIYASHCPRRLLHIHHALLQWWDGYVELLIRSGVAEKDSTDSSRCSHAVAQEAHCYCAHCFNTDYAWLTF
jgi:hypothetical protein